MSTAPLIAGTAARPEAFASSVARSNLAYVGFSLFFFSYYLRPEDWIPAISLIAPQTLGAALAILGLLVIFAHREESLPFKRERWILLALLAWFALLIPFSNWPGGSFRIWKDNVTKIVLMTTILLTVVNTIGRLRKLMAIQVIVITFLAWMSRGNIDPVTGRLSGLSKAFGNANDLAVIIAITISFAVVLLVTSTAFWKLLWLVCAAVLCYVQVLTVSRTGFLSIAAAFCVLIWHYGVKGKRFALVVIPLVLLAAALLVFAPEQYGKRMLSIVDPTYDASGVYKGATGSREGRRQLAERALEVTLENPLFGVGPGQFEEVSGSWHAAHNTFLQFSGEAGIPAFILFTSLIWSAFRSLAITVKRASAQSVTWQLAGALRASLAALCVGLCFANLGYTFFPYFILGFCIVLGRCDELSTAQSSASLPA
jgi:O-antigen ligase